MFGLIERSTKNARVFCVLIDRTKRILLPIIKSNALTNEWEEDTIPENLSTKKRIYSECFNSYQINDFRNMGYYLKRINHSIWFGYGIFHTNTIELLWNNIKNNFTCVNINILLKKFNGNEILIRNYFDRWIYYFLFIRDIVRHKLNLNQRVNLLCDNLKIN